MPSDEVDWSQVTAAYGPATDVPALLAQVYAEDASAREAALGDLWSALCHQGTVYEASALAVPLLLRAAREAPVSPPERDQLLALLACIGRGEDTCWQGYTSWEVVRQCAEAVEAVLPQLVEWARSGSVEGRSGIVEARSGSVEGRSGSVEARSGSVEARRWAVVLAAHHPVAFRELGPPAEELLATQDPQLTRLLTLLVHGHEPEVALLMTIASRDEDVLDWLQDTADDPPARRGRGLVWELAEKHLL